MDTKRHSSSSSFMAGLCIGRTSVKKVVFKHGLEHEYLAKEVSNTERDQMRLPLAVYVCL